MTKFKIITNYKIFVGSNMQQFLNDMHRWRCRMEMKVRIFQVIEQHMQMHGTVDIMMFIGDK